VYGEVLAPDLLADLWRGSYGDFRTAIAPRHSFHRIGDEMTKIQSGD
jgi:hypothetical protein